MSARSLFEDREAIISSLAGSTTTRASEVAAFLAQQLKAQQARADAGRRSAQLKQIRIRAAIRLAAGALPLQLPNWPNVVADRMAMNPAKYGVREAPCDEVIRSEWAALKNEATTVPQSLTD